MIQIGACLLPDRPLLLAPMEDVSDPPFRSVCKANGADLMYTEFISSEGLIRDAAKSLKKLDIFSAERPVGVQIFGENLDSMREATRVVERVQPDILDINFGCPVYKVVCKGAGAAILKDVDKMVRLTREIVQATGLPVTVKTRLGWDTESIRILEVALRLQEVGIKALTVHARTRQQQYTGSADWSWLRTIKEHPDFEIPLFGNGDVDTPEKAADHFTRYRVDGIMIGRAAIGYPWIFNQIKHYLRTGHHLPPPTPDDRAEVCRQHLLASVEWKGEKLGIIEMRRHYAHYFKGLAGAKALRMRLVTCESLPELLDLIDEGRLLVPEARNQQPQVQTQEALLIPNT
jgi:nifR3 family TIM-barrel protein